jgi:hypothetical protein
MLEILCSDFPSEERPDPGVSREMHRVKAFSEGVMVL